MKPYISKHNNKITNTLLAGSFVASCIVSGISLRSNNLTMISLRKAVFIADSKNQDVEKPLEKLRLFVYGHMNTDMTSGSIKQPVQLVNSYSRALAAEKDRVTKETAQLHL